MLGAHALGLAVALQLRLGLCAPPGNESSRRQRRVKPHSYVQQNVSSQGVRLHQHSENPIFWLLRGCKALSDGVKACTDNVCQEKANESKIGGPTCEGGNHCWWAFGRGTHSCRCANSCTVEKPRVLNEDEQEWFEAKTFASAELGAVLWHVDILVPLLGDENFADVFDDFRRTDEQQFNKHLAVVLDKLKDMQCLLDDPEFGKPCDELLDMAIEWIPKIPKQYFGQLLSHFTDVASAQDYLVGTLKPSLDACVVLFEAENFREDEAFNDAWDYVEGTFLPALKNHNDLLANAPFDIKDWQYPGAAVGRPGET